MYTIEASFLVPLFLAMFLLAAQIGIYFVTEIQDTREENVVADMWEVSEFYLYQGGREIFYE